MLLRGQPPSGTPGSVSSGTDPASVHPHSLDLLRTRGFRLIHIDLILVPICLFWKDFFPPPPPLPLLQTQRHLILKTQIYCSQSPKKPRQLFPNQDLLRIPLGATYENYSSQILLNLIGIFPAAKGITGRARNYLFICLFIHSFNTYFLMEKV